MRFKMYIFTIIILSFILIGSVNATDIDTNDTQTISANDKEEIIQMENNLDKLKDNTQGTYSDLKDEFEKATGDITLKKSKYTYKKFFDAGGPIEITKSMVIDGNGAIIDMGISGGQAFKVTASGVTIKNLTIKNAYSDEKGGAIYFSKYGTVENCNFTNNIANYGGAIYFQNGGTVTNCNFNKNTAGSNGGSVYFFGWSTVTNCNFTDNQAKLNGGAIRMISGSITNCKFTNNILSSDYDKGIGGAVFIESDGTVTNCNFNANTATQNCGAIRLSTGSVTNCNFTGNKAKQKGGAIQFNYGGTVANCNFNNNEATNFGGSAVYFNEYGPGTVTNCNFTNNNGGLSGTVFFEKEGHVINCNFDSNTANEAGAIRFDSGSVENCNFTNNKATTHSGGAILIHDSGNVTNCNFNNNQAGNSGGAIHLYSGTGNVTNCNFTNNQAGNSSGAIFMISGTVTKCNFTNNQATNGYGGAIFIGLGNVTNCNFAVNSANRGGAIFSLMWYTTADTCTFKTSSDTTFNIAFISPVLNVDNFTAFYESGEKLTFNLTPANGVPITDGNISISVHHKNGTWVGNYSCLSGEGWTPDLPVGSYYAIFNTEYGGFEPVNRTIKIICDIAYYVNVTSLKTTNKKVNITAISNIPQDILEGELLFILPEGSKINANYAGKGIWWAEHEFAAGDYSITASYTELNNAVINNATISVRYKASVEVNNKTLDLLIGDIFTIKATTTPDGLNVTYVPDNSGVYSIDENGLVTALRKGKGSIIIKVGGDGIYAENTTTVNVTVRKIPTEITVLNETLDLEVNDEIAAGATLKPENAGNLTYTTNDTSVAIVENGKIIAVGEGSAVITVSFSGSVDYAPADNKTIKVTVKRIDTNITVVNATVNLFVKESIDSGVTLKPTNAGNLTYTTNDTSVAIVENGQIIAVGEGTAVITVSFKGDDVYAPAENRTITVNVKRITTNITIENNNVELFVKESINSGATLKPQEAGNLTYTTNDTSVAIVKDGKIIAVGEGTAVITVSFKGDEVYMAAENKTITVKVIKYESKVTILPIAEAVYPNNITIRYSIENKTNVTVTIDGVSTDKIFITNDTITVVGLDAGKYTIIIINNESEMYYKSNDTKSFTVNKLATIISAADVSTTYNINKDLVITLKDADGNLLTGVDVSVDLNGVKNYVTDTNGQVKVSTAGLALKTYSTKITFKGNTNYIGSSAEVKVIINKATPKITAKKKTYKAKKKTKKFTITLKDNAGKPIKNAKVRLIVKKIVKQSKNKSKKKSKKKSKSDKKKIYAKTNNKGKATFKVLRNKPGKYNAKVKFYGDQYYNKATKTVKIVIK